MERFQYRYRPVFKKTLVVVVVYFETQKPPFSISQQKLQWVVTGLQLSEFSWPVKYSLLGVDGKCILDPSNSFDVSDCNCMRNRLFLLIKP